MLSVLRLRSAPLILGTVVLILLLGGCGWFSRSRAKVPATPAPEAVQAPAPPTPPPPQPKPTPPAPAAAPPSAQPAPLPAPPKPAPAVSPSAPPAAALPVPPVSPRKPPAGRIADEEMLRSLVQGKTTRAEVRELFGVPKEVIMGPAIETFVYYRDRSSGFFSRSPERVETLTVRFDVKGILKDFEYRYAGK